MGWHGIRWGRWGSSAGARTIWEGDGEGEQEVAWGKLRPIRVTRIKKKRARGEAVIIDEKAEWVRGSGNDIEWEEEEDTGREARVHAMDKEMVEEIIGEGGNRYNKLRRSELEMWAADADIQGRETHMYVYTDGSMKGEGFEKKLRI